MFRKLSICGLKNFVKIWVKAYQVTYESVFSAFLLKNKPLIFLENFDVKVKNACFTNREFTFTVSEFSFQLYSIDFVVPQNKIWQCIICNTAYLPSVKLHIESYFKIKELLAFNRCLILNVRNWIRTWTHNHLV